MLLASKAIVLKDASNSYNAIQMLSYYFIKSASPYHIKSTYYYAMFLPPVASTTSVSPAMSDVSRRKLTTTSIHIMALDGIVNANSLFTLALFLGITSTNTNNTLIDDNPACIARPSIAESLMAFHVYSFSSFLFSSLIALAIKNVISISKGVDGAVATRKLMHGYELAGEVNTVALRLGTLVSAFGSVFGCGFLVMALVDLVQIKLGTLACGSHYTLSAIAPLLILVPSALFIYVILVLYAFTR